jgi:hypothetical protein
MLLGWSVENKLSEIKKRSSDIRLAVLIRRRLVALDQRP